MRDGRRGGRLVLRLLAVSALVAPLLAACGGNLGPSVKRAAFTSSEYGVAVSPRVTRNPNPPRGGGRYSSYEPYVVRGVTYAPLTEPEGYVATGYASWYGADFHGRRTANGEIFSANAISGAHPTLPLPSYVRVTNLDNGRSLLVRINDRGPYVSNRLIDLSATAAKMLGLIGQGTGLVQVQYVGMAPLNGDDTRMLMNSLNRRTRVEMGGDVRYAMNEVPHAEGGAPPRGTYSAQDFVQDIVGMFSYAAGPDDTSSAEAAAIALAAGVEQGEALRLTLGAFAEPDRAAEVATRFAMLGAVDEEPVLLPAGTPATRLTLIRLKPGATVADAVALARQLGLAIGVPD